MNHSSLTAVVAAALVFSLDAEEAARPAPKRITAARIQQLQMERFGGMVKDARQQKGRVVVVNAQEAASEEWIRKSGADVSSLAKIAVDLQKGEFSLAEPKTVGEATLFVVDDPKLPMSLIAPEGHWAMMNVANLKSDRGVFFEKRVRKAFARTIAYLLGAGSSQADVSVMGCITKPDDYDQIAGEKLPVDVFTKFKRYMAGYGIAPYALVRYQVACQEGWAPAPTNEFQKAVWDKVRAVR